MEEVLTRRQQIAHIATALFRKRGYAATSMRDLASAMGIEAASLYSHIKSKEEILDEICFRIADEFMGAMREVQNTDAQPEALLRLAIQAHIEVITRNLDASAVFLHDWRYLSEPRLSMFIQLRRTYENYLVELVNKGRTSGVFNVLDEKVTVLTLLSGLNWVYDWYKPNGKMSPEALADQLADTFILGIKEKK